MGDSAPVLIWLSDRDQRCIWLNKPWLDFVGRTMEQEYGAGWAENIHDDDREQAYRTYSSAFAGRQPFSMEYRLRRHDGVYRWMLDHGTPYYGSGGEFLGFIGSCIDIDERKHAETALYEADRRKDEFLATLAHELRNPLAPMRNALQLMKLTKNDPAAIEQPRSLMERQLAQMIRLVDDLLDVSRISRGKIVLHRKRTSLAAVVESAVETSRPVIEASQHTLKIEIPAEPIYIEADETRLSQCVANLLNNAAKYTEPGGRIRLSVAREGDAAVVTVADSGVGILPEMLPKVFDMFTQIDRSLERSQGGLGIGLSIVKRLVEMHGGSIEARSEGQGRGSQFVVRLPAMATKATEPAKAADAAAKKRTNGRRILVVDDNVDSAMSLAMMLRMMGHVTHTAHDGLAAIDATLEFRPELILLDIGMPKLNGYDACRRIREQPDGAAIRIIALTGWGQEEDRRRSKEAGFDRHLVKPANLAALEEELAALG